MIQKRVHSGRQFTFSWGQSPRPVKHRPLRLPRSLGPKRVQTVSIFTVVGPIKSQCISFETTLSVPKYFSLFLFSTSTCPNSLAKLPRHSLSLPIASLRQVNGLRYESLGNENHYPGREKSSCFQSGLI